MYQSSTYTKRVAQLRQFLILIADRIIQSPNIQQKSFKLRVNYIPAYTFVYELCNQKPSLQQKMFQQFKDSLSYLIQAYVTQCAKKNHFQFKLENSNQAIQWFNNLWAKFIKFMIVISKKVFSYLDRYYMAGQDQGNLYKAGISLFRKNVLHQGNTKYFLNCYFKQLRQIRQRKMIQNNNLRKFSQSLLIVDRQNIYQGFVKRYFQQTQSYWQNIFNLNSTVLTSYQYYGKIYNMYHFEKNLIQMSCCLSWMQVAVYFQLFGAALVKKYTDVFVNQNDQGLKYMFDKKNIDFMILVNQIYQKFEGFQKIRQAYYNYIISQSDKLSINLSTISTNKNTYPLIDTVYQFYKHHLNLISIGFNKRNELLITLSNAIQKIITKYQQFTHQLFNFCSQIRKNNIFEDNKQKLTITLGKISSKDEFISLYENQLLSKIFSAEINIQHEQKFIFYLHQMYQNELTHKLIKKINDYKQSPKKHEIIVGLPLNINFNISILSLPLWQKKFNDQITFNMNLPNSLQIIWKQIQKNFVQKQPKKKLLVLPFQNKLVLEVKFNFKPCLIKCNLIQACILIYLSQRAYASQQEIILNLMVEKNILQSIIQTLESIPNLIIKTSIGDYLINWNFDFPQPMIDLASKIQQSKQVTKAIKQDRQILLEAAIVKFIKRAKQSMFQQIAQGVHKSIKLFKPQPSNIKLAVEKLIKKGFIEQKQNKVLEYVE